MHYINNIKRIVYLFFSMARNQLLPAGLEMALNQTEKSRIASNYRQFLK